MIGISVYPYKENLDETLAYVHRAGSFGVKRLFTNLLAVENVQDELVKYQQVFEVAHQYGMITSLDVAPSIFTELNITRKDLSFFKDLGVDVIRLDSAFDGFDEALMTFLPEGLKIEMNISYDNPHLQTVQSYMPRNHAIMGCHNFYPQRFTGLDLDHFIKCSKNAHALGIRTAAFINSPSALIGPHPYTDGLCSLEMHRDWDVESQTKHLQQLGTIDDIFVANSYASDEELKAMIALDEDVIEFRVSVPKGITDLEREILFDHTHFNRGDINAYAIRSTFVKLEYQGTEVIENNIVHDLHRGLITVGNSNFGQYKAEVNIVKQTMTQETNVKNLLATIVPEDLFLIDYVKPWTKFKFKEV